MADDVRMLTITELESDTAAARVGIFIEVRDVGDSCGVGETDPDWCGRVIEMWRSGELLRLF
jgi:hypothetical protein